MKRTLKGRKYLGIAGCAAMLAFAPKTLDAEELTVSPRQVESSVKQQKAKSVSFSKRKVVFKHISKRLKIDKKGRHLTKYTLEWKKVSGAQGYCVYRTDKKGNLKLVQKIMRNEKCRFQETVKNPLPEYTIRAFRKNSKTGKLEYSKKTVYRDIEE